MDDADFAPGQYDVYILGGLPADHLTTTQIRLLTLAVEKGAGLIMLGGRSSFGAGGWAGTELARILPVNIGPNDGQIEPGDEGLKVVPDQLGLENYVLRLAPSTPETARIWAALPPITGSNRFGPPKPAAFVLARAGRDPLMIGMDNVGKGRVLAFGGETWPWARSSDEGRLAHAKFWRQAILWLAHKENQGESQVKLKLDARRVAIGQKLDLTAIARDAKNEPISDAQYDTTVTKLDASGKPEGKPEPVPLYPQGDDAKGPTSPAARPASTSSPSRGRRPARRSAPTPPGSWSTRTTASWRTPPPTSPCSSRSPRSPEAPRSAPRIWPSTSRPSVPRRPSTSPSRSIASGTTGPSS